jgi:hypothetical protein
VLGRPVAILSGKPSSDSAVAKDPVRERFDAIFGDLLHEHGYAHRGALRLEGESTFVLEEQEMELALVQDLARRAKTHGVRLKLL